MSKEIGIKATAIVLLVIAAFFGGTLIPGSSPSGMALWVKYVVLAFGVVNVLVALPGTAPLRFIAVASAMATLLSPRSIGGFMTLLIFLAWPVWILIAWSSQPDAPGSPGSNDVDQRSATKAKASTAALVAALAVAALIYHFLVHHQLEQTAALFVGLPAVLAMVVVFWATPRSATGVACRAVTIGMLMSMMFLWEGAVCVVMSAPLFYAIAILIGRAVDVARRKRTRQSTLSCLVLLAVVPMSLEGVTERTSFNRDEWVTESRLVHASAAGVARAIVAAPRFDRPRPLYLRAGFPRATAARIEQTTTGTRWLVAIAGGEMKLNGMEPRTGTLVLQLEDARAGSMRWRVISDDSHTTHFLRWRDARVEWESAGEGVTRVTWSLHYDRGLDPAWYFGPWERYAARLAAGYLIDAVATP